MSLVRDMLQKYKQGDTSVEPDVMVYTILIKACTHIRGSSKDKQQALNMAIDAMEVLENSDFGPPNDVAYATFLTAIVRLSESHQQREDLLEAAFRNCAERGYVSKKVVKEMNHVGSRRLFRRVTNNTYQLHPMWSKNVSMKEKPFS